MQLHNAENDEDLKVLFAMDEALDQLMTTGFRKLISHLTVPDRFNLIAALFNYHLMAKAKAEMGQFCKGLNTPWFLRAMRAAPSIFEMYFTQIETNLAPGIYTRHICPFDQCILTQHAY